MFAIDDDDDNSSSANDAAGDGLDSAAPKPEQVELVSLKTWLDKPDVVNKFKCFYREKREVNGQSKLEWVPG